MTTSERVYVFGGTGTVGTAAVKELLKNGVSVTLYARSPAKAQGLLPNEPTLTIVEGDINDLKPLEQTIAGHTRLFLLVSDFTKFVKLKTAIAEKAYAGGVKQIVDISSIASAFPWRSSPISISHQEAEQNIVNIQDRDVHMIKAANALVDTQEPETLQQWISPNDIALTAANILREPIEKHGDAVYALIGDVMSLKDRAELLSKVLGRPIAYKKATPEEHYKTLTKTIGFRHSVAFSFLNTKFPFDVDVTPGFSILLGRAPETLAQYLEANKEALL